MIPESVGSSLLETKRFFLSSLLDLILEEERLFLAAFHFIPDFISFRLDLRLNLIRFLPGASDTHLERGLML